MSFRSLFFLFFFFFNDTATTEIYTLSLHDALPIYIADRLLFRSALPLQRRFHHDPTHIVERNVSSTCTVNQASGGNLDGQRRTWLRRWTSTVVSTNNREPVSRGVARLFCKSVWLQTDRRANQKG